MSLTGRKLSVGRIRYWELLQAPTGRELHHPSVSEQLRSPACLPAFPGPGAPGPRHPLPLRRRSAVQKALGRGLPDLPRNNTEVTQI